MLNCWEDNAESTRSIFCSCDKGKVKDKGDKGPFKRNFGGCVVQGRRNWSPEKCFRNRVQFLFHFKKLICLLEKVISILNKSLQPPLAAGLHHFSAWSSLLGPTTGHHYGVSVGESHNSFLSAWLRSKRLNKTRNCEEVDVESDGGKENRVEAITLNQRRGQTKMAANGIPILRVFNFQAFHIARNRLSISHSAGPSEPSLLILTYLNLPPRMWCRWAFTMQKRWSAHGIKHMRNMQISSTGFSIIWSIIN